MYRKVELLGLVRNKMSLHVLHELVGSLARGEEQGNEDSFDGSVVWLVWMDAWIATVLTFVTERETWGQLCQKLNADTYGRIAKLAIVWLIAIVRMVVEYWA